MPAVLAHHVLGAAHPADRLVLAAIGALGDQLVAMQAVDADETAGELGRPQPRLSATRAGGAPKRAALGALNLCISP